VKKKGWSISLNCGVTPHQSETPSNYFKLQVTPGDDETSIN